MGSFDKTYPTAAMDPVLPLSIVARHCSQTLSEGERQCLAVLSRCADSDPLTWIAFPDRKLEQLRDGRLPVGCWRIVSEMNRRASAVQRSDAEPSASVPDIWSNDDVDFWSKDDDDTAGARKRKPGYRMRQPKGGRSNRSIRLVERSLDDFSVLH